MFCGLKRSDFDLNIYGGVVTHDMREAHDKIVGLALNGMGNGMEPGPSN